MTQLNWLPPAILMWTLFFVAGESTKDADWAPTSASRAYMIYDLELERNIRAKLETDERLKAAIDVTAEAAKSQVTISGAVASKAFRDKAVNLAKSAHEGLVVKDRITIKPEA
jgi:osmotically-inducible protein OsmY